MKFMTPDARFGATLESLLARRERSAEHEGDKFGASRMFNQLATRVIADIKPGMHVLEVDPGAGHFTRLFLARGANVTALEPSQTFADALVATIDDERLEVVVGFTEDLPEEEHYDIAVVTFPARRGMGLLELVNELTEITNGKILVVLPDDGSLDWAYLTRGAAIEGFEVSTRFITEGPSVPIEDMKRGVILSVDAVDGVRSIKPQEAWGLSARSIEVPYPVPRGAATRLVRYFVAGGDRAVLIKTDKVGLNRLYGNLRTAAHRIARDEVTVRRVDEGIQLMLIPRSED